MTIEEVNMEWAKDYLATRYLGHGLYLSLIPMIFTVRVAVCTPKSIEEFWCYEGMNEALVGWVMYPEIPDGWTRHHKAGSGDEYPD